jgi:hypothetical protein
MIQFSLPAEWTIWKAVSWWNIDVWVPFKILLLLILIFLPQWLRKTKKRKQNKKSNKYLNLSWALPIYLIFGCLTIYPPFHGQAVTLSGRKLKKATILRNLGSRTFNPFFGEYNYLSTGLNMVSTKCDDKGEFYFPLVLDLKLFPLQVIERRSLNCFTANGHAFLDNLSYAKVCSSILDKKTYGQVAFEDNFYAVERSLELALYGNSFAVEKIAQSQQRLILDGLQNRDLQDSYKEYKDEISKLLANRIYAERIKNTKTRKFFGLT